MKSRSLTLLLTLTSGLLSFVLLSTLETHIQGALSARARDLLGADLALSSRRWILDSEILAAKQALKKLTDATEAPSQTELIELFTMASTPGRTPQLVELNAVEPNYPLVGSLEFEAPCPGQKTCVYGDDALAIKWDLKSGQSTIKLGEATFTWGGKIVRDSSRSLRGGSLAPRVVVSRKDLSATGLLRTGSTFTVRELFALPTAPSTAKLKATSRTLNQAITDPGVQIQIPEDAAADEGRLLANVGDFLGLTALVGLLLSFLGCYWLLRNTVQQDAQSWAIYRVLSPTKWQANRPFWKMTLGLSVASATLALVISQVLWWCASPWISHFLLMEGALSRSISPATLLQAFVLSGVTLGFALVPSLSFLNRQASHNLVDLLKNPKILAERPGLRTRDLMLLALVLLGVSRWVAHSWRVAGLFLAGLGACALVLWLMGRVFLASLERVSVTAPSASRRLSLLALSRLRSSSLLLWITFGLGALLITLMPLVEQSMRKQLSDPRDAGPVPGLFLFDIQEEQLGPLEQWAQSQGSPLEFVTPLVRGRLIQVNDTPFEKLSDAPTTREEEREARFRNRGFNLTYRQDLTPSERIVEGRVFDPKSPPHAPEQITVERRFAERLKLKIGDHLQFDIQGVPIEASIVGIRQVQWTSFQPNFFIVFEPGALVDAPKTYLAALPAMAVDGREKLQRSLFESFPNVSTIDVTRVMETLLEGFGQISQALALMALLSSVAGAVAIFSVAKLRASERMAELQLLKLLGIQKRDLLFSVTGELAVLASAASIAGMTLATGLAGALSHWIFESPVEWPKPVLAAGVLLGFLLSSTLLGYFACRRAVNEPPGDWLRVMSQEV